MCVQPGVLNNQVSANTTMFPSSTPSSKRDFSAYPTSTPLNQVYPQAATASTSPNATANNASLAQASAPSTAARTYKTRERLYYETEYVKTPSTQSGDNNNSNNPSSSTNLFEPFLRKQQTSGSEGQEEELPPTASLHEYLLSGGANSLNSPNVRNANNGNGPNSNTFSALAGSPMVINGVIGSPLKSSSTNMEGSGDTQTQWSSVFVSGGPQQMTRSITVFGFPPNNRTDVLLSFQTHGVIENYDLGEGNNWLHITYESEWAAQKALARNGSIFQPIGVMVGVIPMQNALEKVSSAANSFMSPLKTTTTTTNKSNRSATSTVVEEPISIFKSSVSSKNNSKFPADAINSLPSESSIVTKAVNYIFGW